MTLLKKGAAADKNSARVSIRWDACLWRKENTPKPSKVCNRDIPGQRTGQRNAGNVANLLQQLGKTAEWAEFLQRAVEETPVPMLN